MHRLQGKVSLAVWSPKWIPGKPALSPHIFRQENKRQGSDRSSFVSFFDASTLIHHKAAPQNCPALLRPLGPGASPQHHTQSQVFTQQLSLRDTFKEAVWKSLLDGWPFAKVRLPTGNWGKGLCRGENKEWIKVGPEFMVKH